MMVHRFTPRIYYNSFGKQEPVLKISPEDRVITTTADAHGYNEHMEQVALKDNPLTGPFYIEGAEPGDALAVHLEITRPNRNTGWSSSIFAPNVVEPSYVRNLPEKEYINWNIDPGKRTAEYIDPLTGSTVLVLPLLPMLGCIGVAPPKGQLISSRTSGEYGGNMDYRGFSEGAIVYFPVFEEGALLYLGDGHALQGDGEPAGTGIETSFAVQFRVDLLKRKRIQWPRGERPEHIFTVGNARPLEQAVQHALSEMIRWLQEDYGLDMAVSSMILGQVAEIDLGNIFNPAYTMACKLKKSFISHLSKGRSDAKEGNC